MIGKLRRHGTTLALTAAACALGAYVVWFDPDSVSTDEAELRKKNLLPAWRTDDLEEVKIESGAEVVRFVRHPADAAGNRPWDVEIDGQRHPAEEQVLFDQLLGTLEFATFEREIPDDSVDRGAFGLDDPVRTVTARMGELELRVAIGGEAPTPPGSRYAEVVGRGVYVISQALADHLDVDPEAYRSKSVVPYLVMDLSALELDGEGGARPFVRAPWSGGRGAGFRFDGTSPEGDVRVDAEVLDAALVAFGRMQAVAFLPLAEGEAALERRVTVTMTPKDGRERGVLEVGGDCPDREDATVVVRRSPDPLAACVPAAIVAPLTRPASDFVDRGAIGASFDEISAVILTEGGKTLDLARKGPAFTLRAPTDRPITQEIGAAFLDALLEVDGALVDPKQAKGLDPPLRTARVQSLTESLAGNSERTEDLEIGEPQGDETFIRRKEDGAVLRVPTHLARRFEPSVVPLRDRAIFDGPMTDWATLVLEPEGGARQRVSRSATGGLDLAEPEGPGLEVDAGLTADIVAAVGHLTASRWAAEVVDPSFGLERPRLTISVVEHGDEGSNPAEQTLRIGAATEGGFFAQAEDDEAVFVAPAGFVTAVDRLVLNRDVMRVLGADVSRVTLRAGGDRLVAETRSGAWKLTGDAASEPSADITAGKLRDALSDLRAEGAVSIGPPAPAHGFGEPTATLEVERTGGQRMLVTFGATDVFRGVAATYARLEGVDATYAVAQSRVRALLDLAR
jgi:hypothetical protein